jgi:heterodisulfide reductase subunit A-like polyferredoxin
MEIHHGDSGCDACRNMFWQTACAFTSASVLGQQRHRPLSWSAAMKRRPLHTSVDVVIVGAGHNGLVAATLLARKGVKVCLPHRE